MGDFSPRSLDVFAAVLAALRQELVDATQDPRLEQVAESKRASAENLVQYLRLRRHDLRDLQAALSARGLSSLGRCEADALGSVEAVLSVLNGLTGVEPVAPETPFLPGRAREQLAERADLLLGPARPERAVRIMVTLPTAAGTTPALARSLIEAGMDVARINCGRDEPDAWRAMAHAVRDASRETGQGCRVLMDLSGPKLRVGSIAPGPPVLRLRPSRDGYGRILAPAPVWLTASEAPVAPPVPAAVLPVPGPWLEELREGAVLRLRDTRDSHRAITVGAAAAGGRWAAVEDTTYLATGTVLVTDGARASTAQVGALPPLEGRIRLHAGDQLVLTRDPLPGQPSRDGEPARIPCTLPEVFDAARPGQGLLIDDGRFGGRIVRVAPDELTVELDAAPPAGGWLREGRGINLPDTDLPMSALTSKDEADIPLVAQYADVAGLSFVSDPDEVRRARGLLAEAGGHDVGLVLKIETEAAFHALPDLLLAAMCSEAPEGVMIARGDLAVEAGYERLAELQEEILWLCEAAHVPAIWATEVLDRLAKTGRPSRAEITDAAMAERAECVMLNKGPNIVEAVGTLDGILRRMADHQHKKTSLLRPLRSFEPAGAS